MTRFPHDGALREIQASIESVDVERGVLVLRYTRVLQAEVVEDDPRTVCFFYWVNGDELTKQVGECEAELEPDGEVFVRKQNFVVPKHGLPAMPE
jgi:hypothetical protein